MQVENTAIPEVLLVTPKRFGDARGYFSETWNRETWKKSGLDVNFVQDNHSRSEKKGTLRGLHYQSPPMAQDKLIRVISGSILDVAVDARKGSPNFGKWVGEKLSEENGKQLFVPRGFLHGFVTLENDTQVIYKCSNFYAPECDGSVSFDDPILAIDWGVDRSSAILSEKDANAESFSDFDSPFKYESTI